MAHRKLNLVKEDLIKSLNKSEKLAFVASEWNRAGKISGVPQILNRSFRHGCWFSLFKWFSSLGKISRNSFILYLMGKSTPNGFKPTRYVLPKNRQHANEFCRGDRKFAGWDDVNFVTTRSAQFFLDGKPFTNSLRTVQNSLDNMKTIRNAIAHQSTESQEKFEKSCSSCNRALSCKNKPWQFPSKEYCRINTSYKLYRVFFSILLSTASKIIPS